MELFSVFVTGANRGIGLGLVKHLLQLPSPPKYVFASHRSSSGIEALEDIRDKSKHSQVLLIQMDVTKKTDIESARKIVGDIVEDRGLTLLINNSAIMEHQKFPEITEEHLLNHFKVNTVAPVMIVQEFLPLLQKAASHNSSVSKMSVNKAAVLNISAVLGSLVHVEDYFGGYGVVCPSYNISKAGLNMAMRTIGAQLKEQEILVVMICPGWVKTDMGSDKAPLTVDESVTAILRTMAELNESHHTTFMNRNGDKYQF